MLNRPQDKSGTGRIVVLTGAGISKESGLDTFRDADGIWSKMKLEDVATPEAFERDPERVHEFYNFRRAGLLDPALQPNAAHRALAQLEQEWQGDFLLVTQNIDNLHERAGSEKLLHMHGELLKARCLACDSVHEWPQDLDRDTLCAACGQAGQLRVDVVWFGEMPYHMAEIYSALAECDLFISIGTSGSVYPAAGFVEQVRAYERGHTVELNLEPSEGHSLFHEAHQGPATELVPAFVSRLLAGEVL
ncbi:MAG TPA: Sir2 family NAD+-dependent deacetylase [Kiloniellales bacterium]|nr:Sir2 family NAD+-dependent deacetylase [Kiloniellales bacterium]